MKKVIAIVIALVMAFSCSALCWAEVIGLTDYTAGIYAVGYKIIIPDSYADAYEIKYDISDREGAITEVKTDEDRALVCDLKITTTEPVVVMGRIIAPNTNANTGWTGVCVCIDLPVNQEETTDEPTTQEVTEPATEQDSETEIDEVIVDYSEPSTVEETTVEETETPVSTEAVTEVKTSAPAINVNIGDIDIPDISVGDVDIPEFSIPDINIKTEGKTKVETTTKATSVEEEPIIIEDAEVSAVPNTGSTSVGIAAFAAVSVAAAAAYVCRKKS